MHALAHITGGGIPGNLVRVLPDNCHAIVDETSWKWPELFDLLAETADIERAEMYRAFNCGVGMIVAIAAQDKETALTTLAKHDVAAFEMGRIEAGSGEAPVMII